MENIRGTMAKVILYLVMVFVLCSFTFAICNFEINNKWTEVFQSHQYPKDTPINIEADYTFLDSEKSFTDVFRANPFYELYDTREAITTLEYTDDKTKTKTKKKINKEEVIKT